MEHLIGHMLAPVVGRAFFRAVRRWPELFAALAMGGQGVAIATLLAGVAMNQWVLIALSAFTFIFYSWLLLMLLVKLFRGTWDAFCDWGISVFEKK